MRRRSVMSLIIFSVLLFPLISCADDYDQYNDGTQSYQQDDSDNYYQQSSADDNQIAPIDDQQFNFQDDNNYSPSKKHRKSKHHQAIDPPTAAIQDDGIPSRLPPYIQSAGEKLILVDPSVHEWGAYNAQGKLINSGAASAGSSWCSDIDSACRTKVGQFRIYSLGDADCYSKKFPVPDGGAPMPYCMYFNGGQAIHGSDEVYSDNASHGCVRIHVEDAEWLRFNFAEGPNASNHFRGTLVVVRPY